MAFFIARHIHMPVCRTSNAFFVTPLVSRDLRFLLRRQFSTEDTQKPTTALSTLDPARLQDSDYIDLGTDVNLAFQDKLDKSKSFQLAYSFDLPPRKSLVPPPTPKGHRKSQEHLKNYELRPFPPGTKGFLYYKKDSKELRFRQVDSPSASEFRKGRDLIAPNGLLWSIPYFKILSTKYSKLTLKPVHDVLLRDGLADGVDEATFKRFSNIGILMDRATVLMTPDDVFPLSLGEKNYVFTKAGGGCKTMGVLCFYASHPSDSPVPHYTGIVHVKVDYVRQSDAISPSEKRTKTLRGLRIVKCVSVSPTAADDGTFTAPAEGQLVQTAVRLNHLGLKPDGAYILRPQCWTFDTSENSDSAGLAIKSLVRLLMKERHGERSYSWQKYDPKYNREAEAKE